MVEISLSGAGEGPGWETSRPTLQRHFYLGVCGSASQEPPPPGLRIASWYRGLRLQVSSLALADTNNTGGWGRARNPSGAAARTVVPRHRVWPRGRRACNGGVSLERTTPLSVCNPVPPQLSPSRSTPGGLLLYPILRRESSPRRTMLCRSMPCAEARWRGCRAALGTQEGPWAWRGR
jgi:hypothetical protein